jgi:hypothetical protein
MDVGSSERLAGQNLQIHIQLKLGLYQSGSFHPASGKNRFTSSRPDAVLVAPIAKTKKQQTSKQRTSKKQ